MDGFELAELMRGSERMTRLIEDMLDLSRARLAGGIPLKKEHADPGLLVQRIVQEAQAAAPDRRIEVLQEGTLAGEWDADRLSQAASNLIGNALQHGKDGMAVEVRLDGTRDDMVSRGCPMRERSRPTSCRTSSIRSGTRRARTRTAKGSGWASTSSSRS
jgi:signal transduction histidine kinase